MILNVGRWFLGGIFMAGVVSLFFLEIWELNKGGWFETGRKEEKLKIVDGGEVRAALAKTDETGMEISEKVVTADARPELIKRYLAKYKSPLLPYSDLIFELSQIYGFEYYWIVAIAQQESNLCKKIPSESHNCWGYGIHKKGTLRFANYELALRSYAEYLKRQYFDKGLNTPELIMKKYCPHSNGSWAFGVNHFIEEIEGGV